MTRLGRLALVAAGLLLVGGGAIGVGAFSRWREVVRQRVESKQRGAELRGKEGLSREEACWLAKDWYHHGKGLGGLRPLVECRGPLEEVPGGLKLVDVVTQSDFLQGRHRTSLCLVRGTSWEVLGDDWHFRDCKDLPKVGGAQESVAALRADVTAAVQKARRAVEQSLETIELAPETCPPALSIAAEQVVMVDADRLARGDRRGPGPVPHAQEWLACDPGDAGVSDEGFASFLCGRGRRIEWTYALVHRVELVEPVLRDERTFVGGEVRGVVSLVDLSKARAVCKTNVDARMTDRVIGRQGAGGAEVRAKYLEAVRLALEEAKRRLITTP